jgi:predicted dehydrogenase
MGKLFSDLNILVIGLGSMGKRRIRNLMANGVTKISGFDTKEARRREVVSLYSIQTYAGFEEALKEQSFDAWIISVPPDVHHVYMKQAIEKKVPAFIEASVVDTDMKAIIEDAAKNTVFLAPSCTLFFHPAIQKITELLKQKTFGRVSNIIYHSGQYLPDWHTYEKVSDYYVSQKETGGAREIVPFEMTWLSIVLGFPQRVTAFYKKTIEIEGAEKIDDTYNLLLDYPDFIVNLSVDVVSRYATRRFLINGEKAQLYWDWNENQIRVFDASTQQWQSISYEIAEAQGGYNKNITETMYDREIEAFLNGATNKGSYPNTLENDHKVLELLYAAEKSSDSNTIQKFS